MTAARALAELARWGLLLLQDKTLPNLAALVAGETVRGSWWGHPSGHEIFRIAGELEDHGDVAIAKLVSGKVTFVHRRLFAALVDAGVRADDAGVSPDARALLETVRREGSGVRGKGKPVKELETRLLVHGHQVHTDSGRHETELEAWPTFAARVGVAAGAREDLEGAVAEMNRAVGGNGKLPWQ
jgi:hypothetical protein